MPESTGLPEVVSSEEAAYLQIPAQRLPQDVVIMTREQFDSLEANMAMKNHDMDAFYFCAGVFVTCLIVITTALPDKRILADGFVIATLVFGLAAAYTGRRAQVAGTIVKAIRATISGRQGNVG